MSRATKAWILAGAALVAACGPGGGEGPEPDARPPAPDAGFDAGPVPVPDAAPDATPDAGPTTPESCLPGCAGSRAFDAQAYDLSAEVDWDASAIHARETITLIPAADAPVISLDADGLVVTGVHAGGQPLAYAVDAEARTLRVDLTPLAPGGAPVTFVVAYDAPASGSLFFFRPRRDDPAQSRIAYTVSEPIYGSRWLAAKHDPSDRALFSVTLAVPPEHDVIANGQRISDEVVADQRVVRYEMDRPLPTYLMAFATGDLVHAERAKGRTPISLWYRRGLAVDPTVNLDIVASAMRELEARLGRYPFDSYATVLIPEFLHGGMEHATITFNNERSGLGNGNAPLNAHELAHHWFGDWVTMRTYDDVWVKEGMATLLESEVTGAGRDLAGTGRRFGGDFIYRQGAAIVDAELTGLDKYYTGGPYQRGAWLITQIRERVGDEVFWATLRDVLDEYALDSIDGESFVRSFAPALDEATIARILASLDEHIAPTIDIETASVEAGTDVTFVLQDPSATLVTPVEVTVVDALGAAVVHTLGVDLATTLTVPSGGYLAPDERDLHPWSRTFTTSATWGSLAPLFFPGTAEGRRTLEDRSPRHQEVATGEGFFYVESPDELAGMVRRLDSRRARASATRQGCGLATWSGDPAPWQPTLGALLREPAEPRFDPNLGQCGAELPPAIFGAELRAQLATPAATGLARLEYLLSFDYGADSLDLIGRVATGALGLATRDDALWRLAYQANPWFIYTPVPDEQRPAWAAFFRERLADSSSRTRFLPVWYGVTGLGDAAALPVLADVFDDQRLSAADQAWVLCGAHALAADPAAWDALVAASAGWTTLAPAAAEVLADPGVCGP
jgi:aminopeptidase N